MKPVVGIMRWWSKDLPWEETPFDFRPIKQVTKDNCAQIAAEHDAIILPLFGLNVRLVEDCNWRMLLGGHAKVAMWSVDSHNEGWAATECEVAPYLDRFFTAHSSFIPQIGPNAVWVPCACSAHEGTQRIPRRQCLPRFDFGTSACSYNNDRDRVINGFQHQLEEAGYTYVFGQTSPKFTMEFYSMARAVVNVNQNTDLNMRQFEALSTGAPVLMTPAHDWNSPRFDRLRDCAIVAPRVPEARMFKDLAKKAVSILAGGAEQEIFLRHRLHHRFTEMAEVLLS
jgi:hypothetical protein